MENAQKHQGDNRKISTIQMFVFFWGGARFNTVFLGIQIVKNDFIWKKRSWGLLPSVCRVCCLWPPDVFYGTGTFSILGALPKPQKKLLMHKSHLEVTKSNRKDLQERVHWNSKPVCWWKRQSIHVCIPWTAVFALSPIGAGFCSLIHQQ